jgi:PAS domain S-box-containing protein
VRLQLRSRDAGQVRARLSWLGGRWADSVALRLLLPGIALAVLLVAAFLAQRDSTSKLSESFRQQTKLAREIGLAQDSQKLLLDLETGLRGYVITHDRRFLQPWQQARTGYPATASKLVALETPDGGPDLVLARKVLSDGESYVRDYAAPRVRAALARARGASSLVVALDGKRRVDGLRAVFAQLLRRDQAEALSVQSEAKAAAASASDYELAGTLGALLLLVLAGVYVRGAVLRPIRRVADAADAMAAGDLSARVEPKSSMELSRLAISFNAMADALRDGRDRMHRQAAELRSSEAFLDSVLEHIPNMIFVKDACELRFVRFNRAGEELLGCSRDDLIGKNDYDLFPEEEANFFTKIDREVLAGGTLLDIPEEPIQTRDKGSRYLHTKKIPLADGQGEPRYLLGISEDITERKHADEAVRDAKEQAERANRAKSEFLSRMSHELRTPLNSILGFGQLLEMNELTEDQRESVHYILKSGRHLLTLINEVLDISRIEAGTLSISPEPVAIHALLGDLVTMVSPLAAERDIRVEVRRPEGNSHVYADQQRLKQVLLNLLSNAIKYNREGGKVSVDCEHAGPNLRILVRDTGRGIPAERLSQVFSPFDRLGAEDGEIEGTGLGLAISQHLVQMMGGTLSVDSEPGTGSTFTVELALVEETAEPAASESTVRAYECDHNQPSARLLYVEDNPANIKLIERVLERRRDTTVEAALQGRLGIELARHQQPDVILLDLHLPDLTGEEVLSALKSDPRTEKIPVIMLTADASRHQAKRLQDLGADAYLTKPLDVPTFLATLDTVLPAGALVSE